MDIVTVKDKKFALSIPETEIRQRIAQVAAQISKDMEGKCPLFLAVLNGSFMYAADLLRSITIPCEVSFVRMASYSGMQSTGTVRELLGLTESIENRPVIVVEDIIDSGLTMQELLKMLHARKPSEVRVASLLVKPDNLEVELSIDYTCFNIPNDFIVGYGLDYDGQGRNLPAIYTVIQ